MRFLEKFFKRDKVNIGIDIGSHSLKVAVIEEQPGEELILKEALYFPVLSESSEELGDEEFIVNALKSVKGAVPKGKFMAVLPSNASLVTTFPLPPEVTEDNVEYILIEEIAKKIPVSIAEVNFDYFMVEKDKKKFITAVIGKKEAIRKLISIHEKAGITLESVTSAYTALSNIFFVNYPDFGSEFIFLVDVGYSVSTFCFLSGSLMLHGRSSNMGSKRIEDYISCAMNIEPQQVGELMEKNEVDEQIMEEAVKSFVQTLAEEIEAYSIFCEQQYGINKGEMVKLYVSGGVVELPKFVPLLSSTLPENFKAIQLDPFRNIRISPEITSRISDLKSIFSIAMGVAVS